MKIRLFLPMILILTACGNGKVDTSKLQEEMKAREIRVIPEAKIIARTLAIGDSLVKSLDATMALAQAGTPAKTWREAEVEFNCKAYRIDGEYNLTEKEAGVFEAYKYNAANGISADPNAQKISQDIIVYNAPIEENGQVLGMWSLQLPRRYVILSIDQ